MELDIHFKNVGQGDTIIIEWLNDDNHKEYGLIDCNDLHRKSKVANIQPVIKHIQDEKIKSFRFVIMSHPHSDHFSGLLTFINYCESNDIQIEKFIHTGSYDPKFLKSIFKDHKKKFSKKVFKEVVVAPVNLNNHKRLLQKLYKKLIVINKKYRNVFVVNNDYEMSLSKEIKLKFLSPYAYDEEIKNYIKKTFSLGLSSDEYLALTQKYENNPMANFLSTVIQIYSDTDKWQILLCSDAMKSVFLNELLKKGISNKKLLMTQIPHHGSKHNHVKEFWDSLSGKSEADSIISVGKGYDHPNEEVVKYFDKEFRSVHATNYVGGFKKYFDAKKNNPKRKIIELIESIPGIKIKMTTNKDDEVICGEKHFTIRKLEGQIVHEVKTY